MPKIIRVTGRRQAKITDEHSQQPCYLKDNGYITPINKNSIMKIYHTKISNSYIGQQLRARRLLLGWSASILGKNTGLSQQQISRYERGTQNFTIRRLCIFANVLQCDLNYFLHENNTEYRTQSENLF